MAKATWIWVEFLDGHESAYRITEEEKVLEEHGGKIRRIYRGTYAEIRILITCDRLMRKEKDRLLKVYDVENLL